jgi:hypothetical protein
MAIFTQGESMGLPDPCFNAQGSAKRKQGNYSRKYCNLEH